MAPRTLSKDLAPFHELIHLFEVDAKQEKDVLQATGEDVAAFADAFLEGHDVKEDRLKRGH